MQIHDLFLACRHLQLISLAGNPAVIAFQFAIGLLHYKGVGQHGFAHTFKDFVYIVVLGIHGLPVAYHVHVLLAYNELPSIIQFRVRIAETQ